jgi:nitrate reductase gamma subunit
LDELLRLPRDPRVNGFGARTRLQLEIPELTRHALMHAQESLNKLQSRCGCLAGGIATLGTLIYGVTRLAQRDPRWFSLQTLGEIALVLLFAFVAGFIAKMGTLAITRWQFAQRCRAQHSLLVRELLTIRGGHVNVHSMG